MVEGRSVPVILDWSDAAVAHPLVDIGPWFRDPPANADLDRHWEAWLNALAPLGPVDAIRDERERALGVVSGYHLVSYAAIVRNLEPAIRYQLSGGVTGFWEVLEARAEI